MIPIRQWYSGVFRQRPRGARAPRSLGMSEQFSARGFTLIEVVVTLGIVAVLALMATPLIEVVSQRQKENELRTSLRTIRSAIDDYYQAGEDKKIEVSADSSGYPPNLDVLVKGVPDITKPNKPPIYFLRRMPRDPFHPDPNTAAEKTWGKRSYESAADDPKEGDDVYDVYSLSAAVGLNGVPYRQW